MMKNKIMLLTLMTASVGIQAVENDGLKLAALVTGLAATGVVVWRMTAPSDKKVLDDIEQTITDKHLYKYDQKFDTLPKTAEQETLLQQNLNKLNYAVDTSKQSEIQSDLRRDERELTDIRNSIWFRSFFNQNVSNKHSQIDSSRLNATKLQPYFKRHDNYFKGHDVYRKHIDLNVKMHNQDPISYIKTEHLLQSNYPLHLFTGNLITDISWIKSLPKGVYPKLESQLKDVDVVSTDLVVSLKDSLEYEKETQLQYQEDENKRQQALVDAQVKKAQAQYLSAQAANRHANATQRQAEVDEKRVKLERDRNAREKLEYRAKELRRKGFSEREIQAQLEFEGFTGALISLVFGTYE